MFIRWFRERRRRQILSKPTPADWEQTLTANVRDFEAWPSGRRALLLDRIKLLVAEKYWEGCKGLEVTSEIQVTIAAHAARLTLGWPQPAFSRLSRVLIYPDTFVAQRQSAIGPVLIESPEARVGEAWQRGPVILSWKNCLADCTGPVTGRNVIVHEFAHQLDYEDGAANGIPAMPNSGLAERWSVVFAEEFQRLQTHLRLGRPTVLDPYAATNPAEFFAVATETFFERPRPLAERHPRMYELMCDYFQQDPLGDATPM